MIKNDGHCDPIILIRCNNSTSPEAVIYVTLHCIRHSESDVPVIMPAPNLLKKKRSNASIAAQQHKRSGSNYPEKPFHKKKTLQLLIKKKR